MNVIVLSNEKFLEYQDRILRTCESDSEIKLKCAIHGFTELELEDAKKAANVGDYFLIRYTDKVDRLVPMQVMSKNEDGTVDLCSAYILENHVFDENTNVWRDSEIRRYMNSDEFLSKFDPEFVKCLKTAQVHTEDYVTEDKMWLLSHEEIGYEDTNKWFHENKNTKKYEVA